MHYVNTVLLMLLAMAATYAYSEWACAHKPVDLIAARQAYQAKVAEGPKRDRLLAALKQLQDQLDRQSALIEEYRSRSAPQSLENTAY